jgi:glycerol uptake facilitator-like aquaporin
MGKVTQVRECWHVIDDMLHRMSPIAPFMVEFLGTFFLCFTITTLGGQSENAVGVQVLLGPLAIGFSLMVAIFMGGHISGAHVCWLDAAATVLVFDERE